MDWMRKLRIAWGPHKWDLRCNGMEVMWSEMAQVAGCENWRCDRWDNEWRTWERYGLGDSCPRDIATTYRPEIGPSMHMHISGL
jgi:hypothetical protein